MTDHRVFHHVCHNLFLQSVSHKWLYCRNFKLSLNQLFLYFYGHFKQFSSYRTSFFESLNHFSSILMTGFLSVIHNTLSRVSHRCWEHWRGGLGSVHEGGMVSLRWCWKHLWSSWPVSKVTSYKPANLQFY